MELQIDIYSINLRAIQLIRDLSNWIRELIHLRISKIRELSN